MPLVSRNQLSANVSDIVFKDWVRTPRYRQLVVQGAMLPENPFVGYTNEVRSPSVQYWPNWPADPAYTFVGSYQERYGQGWVDARAVLNNDGWFRTPIGGFSTDPWQTFVNSRTTVERNAGNKLSKKLNNLDINLGVALGEARETANFVQGAMMSTFVAARYARRGDLSGVLKALGLSNTTNAQKQKLRDVPDAISRAWLGFSYGVRPLMADVLGACKALEKRHSRPLVMTYRASELCELDIGLRTTSHTRLPSQGGDYDPDYLMKIKGWHRGSDKLSFEVANPFLYSLSQLGLTNPLAVAWELLTLSFVIDWFIPIGSWINGLVPPQGVTKIRRSITWTGDVYFSGGLVWRNGPKGPGFQPVYAHNKWKYRTPSSSFPRYHLVGATFDLSKDQVMSGLSLLWSYGTGRKSESKAWNDAVTLRSRAYSGLSGSSSREKFKGSPWPREYDAL